MAEKKILADYSVVLVEPKTSGNIGAVARAMMNFGCEHLILVNPSCPLDDVCYARAMHADKILDEAKTFDSFTDAVKHFDFLVATSAVESSNDKRHLRNPVFLGEFSKKTRDVTGRVGLIFGREDDGLFNEEIAVCDMLVKIPTSEAYPSLNLSHSVCVVLYSLYLEKQGTSSKMRDLNRVEKQKLYEFFSLLLDNIDYPQHKKEKAQIMFQRLMGRAMPSKWEYHTVMGVLSGAVDHIAKSKKKKEV